MHPLRLCAAFGVVAALTGCAGEGSNQEPMTAATAPRATPAEAGGALTALPECPAPPSATSEDVEGLVLPRGSVVTDVTRQDPLVTVLAFVPLTPIRIEAAYPAMDGITVLVTENEIYEAELLVSNGSHRTFVKATATCSTGSKVMAVVAPEVDAEGLPLPQGGTATVPPSP